MNYIVIIFGMLLAYLIGAIPTAVWVGKWFYGKDVRDFGSGNAGATNTFRVLGKKAGSFVMAFDTFKGFLATSLPVFLSEYAFILPENVVYFQLVFGVLAVLGHIFPVYVGFRGGKGVATVLGMVLALHLGASLAAISVFLVVLLAFRYVSVGSMTAAISFPLFLAFVPNFKQENPTLLIFSIIIALLIIWTHRTNIQKLRNGTENKANLFSKK